MAGSDGDGGDEAELFLHARPIAVPQLHASCFSHARPPCACPLTLVPVPPVPAEAARIAAAEAAEAERLRLIEEERQRRLRLLPPRAEGKAKRIAREPTIEGFDLGELTTLFAAEALADVEDPLAWVVCHATDDEPKKVKVVATGAGGLEELVSKLDDGEVQFGAFRAAAIERKGAKLRCVPSPSRLSSVVLLLRRSDSGCSTCSS